MVSIRFVASAIEVMLNFHLLVKITPQASIYCKYVFQTYISIIFNFQSNYYLILLLQFLRSGLSRPVLEK
jgi:hypothetical protein